MLRIVVAISIAALVVPETLAYTAAEEKVAQAICAQAVKNINILADFTRTDCTFAKDGDALGLIFISVDLVFANERSKKGLFVGARRCRRRGFEREPQGAYHDRLVHGQASRAKKHILHDFRERDRTTPKRH